jgi:lysyl-tRNA synthetase class 2
MMAARATHSSPEYAMKRLIASGLKDIYQMSHVYRYGEEKEAPQPGIQHD